MPPNMVCMVKIRDTQEVSKITVLLFFAH